MFEKKGEKEIKAELQSVSLNLTEHQFTNAQDSGKLLLNGFYKVDPWLINNQKGQNCV